MKCSVCCSSSVSGRPGETSLSPEWTRSAVKRPLAIFEQIRGVKSHGKFLALTGGTTVWVVPNVEQWVSLKKERKECFCFLK